MGLALLLQGTAAALLLHGEATSASSWMYALCGLALFHAVGRDSPLDAAAVLVSMAGLSLVFRDNVMGIRFSTLSLTYAAVGLAVAWRHSGCLVSLRPALAGFAILLLSALWTPEHELRGSIFRILGAAGGMVVVYLAVRRTCGLGVLILAAMTGMIIWVLAVLSYQTPEARFGVLALGVREDYGNPVSYAGTILPWAITAAALWLTRNGWPRRRWLYAGPTAAFVLVLGYTSSRTAVLCLAGAILAMALASGSWRGRLAAIVVLGVCLGGIVLSSAKSETVRHHWNKAVSHGYTMDERTSDRTVQIRYSLPKLALSPFFGHGLNTACVPMQKGGKMVLHNFWLRVAVESGLVGLAPFVWAFWRAAKRALQVTGLQRVLSIGLLSGAFLYGNAAHGLDLVMWPMYGLAVALLPGSFTGLQNKVVRPGGAWIPHREPPLACPMSS